MFRNVIAHPYKASDIILVVHHPVFFDHAGARHCGPVFDDYDLEVLDSLPGKAVEKFVDLVGAVIYWNDD